MPRKAQKKRRDTLFEMSPYCHWCNVKLTDEPGRNNTRTLDHVYSKLNPKRHDPDYENTTVIACRGCNQKRGLEDELRFKRKP